MTTDKPEVMLIGPLKPVVVKGLDAICAVHKVAAANDPDAFIAGPFARARHRLQRHGMQNSRRPDGALPKPRTRLKLRRRLRPHGRQMGRRTQCGADQYARRADRRGRRYRARAVALYRARISPSGAVFARRQMARAQLSAHQGDTAQPHRRHGGHGRHRPGDRAAARRLRRAGGLSHAQAAARRQLSALPEPDRDGARGRYSHGHRAGRARDTEHDQCRSARGARSRRHFDQHGARLGGRRTGADQGACRTSASWRRASTSLPRSPTCRRN